jgi:hypothetical protein
VMVALEAAVCEEGEGEWSGIVCALVVFLMAVLLLQQRWC